MSIAISINKTNYHKIVMSKDLEDRIEIKL